MLYKTKGIVFQTIKYTDNSFIAKIYTALFGLQSFLVNNPRGKKSSTKINVFQPMNLVELVMYRKEKKQLQRIKEIKIDQAFISIPFDNSKTGIVFFLNEILCKCIKEEESRPDFFMFLHNSLNELDKTEKKITNFHLRFLIQLSEHLGFMPGTNFSDAVQVFDLREGVFVRDPNENCLSKQASETLFFIAKASPEEIAGTVIPAVIRREIIYGMLHYFKIHVHGFGEVKSHIVLEDINS